MPHIRLRNVHKSFPTTGEVLTHINFEINKGEFIVLLGPSGSGKSSLLRLIAGLDTPTKGEVKRSSQKHFDKAYVFQEAHLLPWKNVRENVELPLKLIGETAAERLKKSKSALEKVDLLGAANLYPAELSGGMKMRTSLARALVVQPDILLLDEPFAALDESIRFRLAEELRSLWLQHKMTVIFVTHSVQEACFLAERILVLSEKPARIRAEIKIELPAERKSSLRTETEFTDQLKKIYRVINE